MIQAIEEMSTLIDRIEGEGGLVDLGELKKKDAKKLTKELAKAVHKITQSQNIPSACEKLGVFTDKVTELVSDEKLSPANGSILTDSADFTKGTLDCLV